MKKILHFLQYNNLTVLIMVAFFVLSAGVFAQTEIGQEFVGQKETRLEGVDNTLLLMVDIENMDMDFKIEKIESDNEYYYVVYTFLNLIKKDNAWQFQISERNKKISKNIKQDLGAYLGEEFDEEYQDKIKELKKEQQLALQSGENKRTEVTEYSGIIGKTLVLVGKTFSGYEPIKKREIPSPTIPPTILLESNKIIKEDNINASVDNLSDIYNDYIAKTDPDGDNIFGDLDNCPIDYNSDQLDLNNNGVGDVCEKQEVGAETEAVSLEQVMQDNSKIDNGESVVDSSENINSENDQAVEIIDVIPVQGEEQISAE